MSFGGWTETYRVLFQTSAKDLEEFFRSEILEHQSVVELIDSAVRQLLGHVLVRSVQLSENQSTLTTALDSQFLDF